MRHLIEATKGRAPGGRPTDLEAAKDAVAQAATHLHGRLLAITTIGKRGLPAALRTAPETTHPLGLTALVALDMAALRATLAARHVVGEEIAWVEAAIAAAIARRLGIAAARGDQGIEVTVESMTPAERAEGRLPLRILIPRYVARPVGEQAAPGLRALLERLAIQRAGTGA